MATAPSEGPSVPEPGLPEIGPNGELLLPATPEPTSTRFVNEPAPVPRPRVRRHLFHHRFNILPEQYRLPRPRDDPALLMALRVLGVNEVVEVLSEDSEEVEERQSDSEMSDGEESEDENMELAENGDSEENVEDEEIIEEEIEEEEEVEEEVEITEERSDKKEEKHNYDLKSVIPHQLSLLGIDSDNPVDTILRSHVFRTEKPDDDSDTGIVDESQPSTSSGIVNEKYDVEHLENPRKLVNSYIGRQSKINYLEDVNSFSLTEARSVIDSAEKFREVKLKWRKLSKLSIVGESVKKGAPNFGEPQPDFDVSSDEGDSELPRRNRLLPIKRDFDNSEYEDDISTDEEGEPHYSDRERSVDLSSDEDEEVSISSDDKSSENNEDVEMDDSSGIEEDSVNSDQVMETGSEGEETAEGGDENENLKYEENSSEEDEEEDEEQVQSYDDDESEEEDEEDKEEVDEKESIEQGSSVASENEEEDEEEDEEEEEEEDNVNENPEESDNEEEIEENETEEIRDEEGDDEQEDEGETGEEYSDEEEEENEQDEVEPEEEEESVSNREIVVRKSTPEVITLSSDPSVDDNDSIDERQLRKETRRLRRLYYSAEKRAAEMVYARNKIKTAQDTPILIELQEMRLRKKLSILSDTVCTGIEQLSLPCRTSADHFEKEADVLMEEVATSRVLNKSRLNAPQDRDQKEFVPLLEPQENETEKYNKEDCVPPLDIEYNNERAGIRYRKLEMQKGIKSSLANRFIKHNLEGLNFENQIPLSVLIQS